MRKVIAIAVLLGMSTTLAAQQAVGSFAEPKGGKANNTAVARAKFVDAATAPRVEDVQVIYQAAGQSAPSPWSVMWSPSRSLRDGSASQFPFAVSERHDLSSLSDAAPAAAPQR